MMRRFINFLLTFILIQQGSILNAAHQYMFLKNPDKLRIYIGFLIRYGQIGEFKEVLNEHPEQLSEYGFEGEYLCDAAKFNRVEILKYLLSHKVDVNTKNKYTGETALHCAAPLDSHIPEALEAAKILLSSRINKEIADNYGYTALDRAMSSNRLEVATLLINKGANLNTKQGKFNNYLIRGVTDRRIEFIKAFMKRKFDVNAKNYKGETAVFWALYNGDREILSLLLKNHGDLNVETNYGMTSLHAAARGGLYDYFQNLLKLKYDPRAVTTVTKGNCLHYAAMSGNIDIAKFMINEVDVNSRDSQKVTPLMYAFANGHEEMARFLIENKADINARDADNGTSLHYAAIGGLENQVKYLLEKGFSVKTQWGYSRRTPIACVSSKSHETQYNIIKMLLKAGSDPNYMNPSNKVSLLETIISGMYFGDEDGNLKKTVALMIDNGADIFPENPRGRGVILGATVQYPEILELLIQRGKKNRYFKEGLNHALYNAISGYQKKSAEILIRAGTDLYAQNNGGHSFLYSAIVNSGWENTNSIWEYNEINDEERNFEMVKLLFDHGFNLKKPVKNTEPLIQAALQKGYFKIAEYLIQKGADPDNVNTAGDKALHVAALHGYVWNYAGNVNEYHIVKGYNQFLKITEMLVGAGADVNARGGDGSTPVSDAAEYGDMDIKNYLLRHGSQSEKKTGNSGTVRSIMPEY